MSDGNITELPGLDKAAILFQILGPSSEIQRKFQSFGGLEV